MYNVSKKFPSATAAYFLDYYYPANQGSQNYFSKKLLDFKDGNSEGYNFFYNQIEKSRTDLLGCDVVIRALGSEETNPIGNFNHPLHLLLKSKLLNNDNVGYQLSKPVTNQLKFAGSSANRKQILNNTYSCKPSIRKYNSVLIVDDVITTGTTIEEIIRSIKAQKSTMRIIVFCLSKTYSSLGKEYPKVQSIAPAPSKSSSTVIKKKSTRKVQSEKPKSKSTYRPEPEKVDEGFSWGLWFFLILIVAVGIFAPKVLGYFILLVLFIIMLA